MKNWKAPKTPSEIQSFLGLAGYYRRFIMNFSKIVKPLTSLTQKNQKYEAEDFIVYCDALNQGLGCVLMQRGKHIFDRKELNMCQKRWIKLFSDYDYDIRYYPKDVTVVADALSRKERVKAR
ncbi:hypothetical protein Tco_1580235 [Tanacetum coccineum]